MKVIRKNSKRGKYYAYMYERATAQSVKEFYKKPSARKIQADYECQQQCRYEHGERYRIICGGIHYFTAAWRTPCGLMIETGHNSYIVK